MIFKMLQIFTDFIFLMSGGLVHLSPYYMMGILFWATFRCMVRMVCFAAFLSLDHIHRIALYLKFWHTFFIADLITWKSYSDGGVGSGSEIKNLWFNAIWAEIRLSGLSYSILSIRSTSNSSTWWLLLL